MKSEIEGFDIIVIGAGPAGCYAAKTIAECGLRTLILEEHGTIGLPRHCSGWLIGAKFTDEIVDVIKDRISKSEGVRLARHKIRRYN